MERECQGAMPDFVEFRENVEDGQTSFRLSKAIRLVKLERSFDQQIVCDQAYISL